MARSSVSSVYIGGLERKLAALPGQARFAAALMLTKLAVAGQKVGREQIERAFDRPTPFTVRGVRFKHATKADLEARVFIAPIQAQYLSIEETGGARVPLPGAPVVVPVQLSVNVYGNIPRGRIKRELAKPDTFVATRGERRTRHLPPGIYRRAGRLDKPRSRRARKSESMFGGRRALEALGAAQELRLLVAFERIASYQPRFNFKARVSAAVQVMVPQKWREALEQTLKTARQP